MPFARRDLSPIIIANRLKSSIKLSFNRKKLDKSNIMRHNLIYNKLLSVGGDV
jgi:hypothetical protein